MPTPIYAAFYSLPLGIIVFILILYVGSLSIKYYNNYISTLVSELEVIFIEKSKRVIITYHMLLTLILCFFGFFVAGIIGLLFSICIAFVVPAIQLKRMKKNYIKQFIYQLPDVMNSMATMLRAGTHLSKAMHLIAEQHVSPISQEFMIVLSDYKMGRDIDRALNDMSARINRQEVELLVTAMAISNNVGGNLTNTLDILSETLRQKIIIEGKIDALTAMGRMQGKIISFIPVGVFGVLYLQDPDWVLPFFYEPLGWVIMSFLILLMILASVIIKRITNIAI